METPYSILGVDEDAGDDAIKYAYLREIRLHPPQQSPHQFERIRKAYEAIETVHARAEYTLFSAPEVDITALLAEHPPASAAPRRPNARQLLAALVDARPGSAS